MKSIICLNLNLNLQCDCLCCKIRIMWKAKCKQSAFNSRAASYRRDCYRPRTKYEGRYCFHRCLSVNISGGGTPSRSGWWGGGTPARSGWLGGTPSQVWGGGYPSQVLMGGTPSQVWVGVYPIQVLMVGGTHLRFGVGGTPSQGLGYPG